MVHFSSVLLAALERRHLNIENRIIYSQNPNIVTISEPEAGVGITLLITSENMQILSSDEKALMNSLIGQFAHMVATTIMQKASFDKAPGGLAGALYAISEKLASILPDLEEAIVAAKSR